MRLIYYGFFVYLTRLFEITKKHNIKLGSPPEVASFQAGAAVGLVSIAWITSFALIFSRLLFSGIQTKAQFGTIYICIAVCYSGIYLTVNKHFNNPNDILTNSQNQRSILLSVFIFTLVSILVVVLAIIFIKPQIVM